MVHGLSCSLGVSSAKGWRGEGRKTMTKPYDCLSARATDTCPKTRADLALNIWVINNFFTRETIIEMKKLKIYLII